jgi:hypothetical protein
VEAASRAALEHLRRTRVPDSFAQLSKASEAYGTAMGAVLVGLYERASTS